VRAVKVAIACLAAAFVLAILEIVVRILGVAPEVKLIDVSVANSVYKRSTNPILGFELKASYRDPNADLVMSYPSTNSHGQRDVERTLAKPPGVRRVILLGASVVEGFGIRDLDDTISRRLEALYDGKTEVLNFGVSAYCTKAKVELLRVKGLAFAPDVVVLFVSQNDFNNFNHEAFQLGSPVDRPRIVEDLFASSEAFRFLCTRLNLFYFAAQFDPIQWNRDAIGDNNVVEGLAAFAQLAAHHGFDPLVAIWPRFTDDRIEDTHPMPGNPSELIVERLARMQGIPSVRFSRHFEAHRASLSDPGVSPRRRYTLGDWIHPNKDACHIAAEALKRELAALPGRADRFRPSVERKPDSLAVAAALVLGRNEPERSRIIVNLGNTLLSQGRFAEAIEQYREALRLKPNLAEAYANLGVALKNQGKLEDALLQYTRALELDPELADVHNNLGVVLFRVGRKDEAIRSFRKALELRPDFRDARRNLELAFLEPAATDSASAGP
jgi:tetratricopeptide (TPR) repeat protein